MGSELLKSNGQVILSVLVTQSQVTNEATVLLSGTSFQVLKLNHGSRQLDSLVVTKTDSMDEDYLDKLFLLAIQYLEQLDPHTPVQLVVFSTQPLQQGTTSKKVLAYLKRTNCKLHYILCSLDFFLSPSIFSETNSLENFAMMLSGSKIIKVTSQDPLEWRAVTAELLCSIFQQTYSGDIVLSSRLVGSAPLYIPCVLLPYQSKIQMENSPKLANNTAQSLFKIGSTLVLNHDAGTMLPSRKLFVEMEVLLDSIDETLLLQSFYFVCTGCTDKEKFYTLANSLRRKSSALLCWREGSGLTRQYFLLLPSATSLVMCARRIAVGEEVVGKPFPYVEVVNPESLALASEILQLVWFTVP